MDCLTFCLSPRRLSDAKEFHQPKRRTLHVHPHSNIQLFLFSKGQRRLQPGIPGPLVKNSTRIHIEKPYNISRFSEALIYIFYIVQSNFTLNKTFFAGELR